MSSRKPIRQREVYNPERILSNMIQDYIQGNLDDYQFLFRAAVVKIDQEGGALETTPPNPKNSIQARVITNARDKDVVDKELPVFWSLFPHDTMPLKEGEHVYVIFEDAAQKNHGLWLCRIPEPSTTDNANLTLGVTKYQQDSVNDFSDVSADRSVQDSDISLSSTPTSPEFVPEAVPKFRARVGDRVIEGSNNTIIVLGRDRVSDENSGIRDAAGSLEIVSGRALTDDFDYENDKSRIVVSMNSDIDTNFNISVGPKANPAAVIGVKSDEIRLVARKGMKLIVEGGDFYVEGANVFLGDKATQSVIQGELFNQLWIKVLTLIANHNHPSPIPNAPSPILLAQLIQTLIDLSKDSTGPALSSTVKVKK